MAVKTKNRQLCDPGRMINHQGSAHANRQQTERRMNMGNFRDNIRRVVPYTPGEQPNRPGMVKLNTNENPYPPAPEVVKAIREMETESLRLYPDPTVSDLVKALAAQYHVRPEQIFVGVGSDDVLAMCFLTYFNSDRPILFPDITYSFYDVWADLFRIPYERPALDDNLHIRPEDYYRENGGIVIANPNAPTGVEQPLSDIEDILRHNPDVIVIVDEAYVDFGAHSALDLLDRYDNLVVVQTFSKSRSLAGMRIGYAFASAELIKALNDVKYSFNSYTMNRAAIAAGTACLQNEAYWKETTGKIIETREYCKEQFARLGFTFQDSRTNFLFVKHEKWSAGRLFQALREADIYVRYFDKPRTRDYLRITIGTREEMEKLLAFLETYTED